MKYKIVEMNEPFLENYPVNAFIKQALYYSVSSEKQAQIYFSTDELFPISTSVACLSVVEKIKDLINLKSKIVISGDYDCDGICASALLYRGLRGFNLDVGYYIPNRHDDGYGLSCKLVELYHQKQYQAIICVDNGVVAHEALALAKTYAMDVIILDHHELDEKSSSYPYLLHPSLMEEPFKYLCGCGVVFEVLRHLKAVDELDYILCACASVGDMMVLDLENRFIVRKGLAYLNKGYGLAFQAMTSSKSFSLEDISMKIVPQLNACGRLYDMCNVNNTVKFLLSEDIDEIHFVSEQIANLNKTRQKLTREALKKYDIDLGFSYPAIIVKGDIHEGLVGLVASSLVNKYQRFTMILSEFEDIYKGSIRSIEGIDVVKMLRGYPNLRSFGGHSAAGGISFLKADYDGLINYICDYIMQLPTIEACQRVLDVKLSDIKLEDLKKLDALKPYLTFKNEPIYLIQSINLNTEITYMSDKLHCKWNIDGVELIYFNAQLSHLDLTKSCFISGNLGINTYNNKSKVVFKIKEIGNTDLLCVSNG